MCTSMCRARVINALSLADVTPQSRRRVAATTRRRPRHGHRERLFLSLSLPRKLPPYPPRRDFGTRACVRVRPTEVCVRACVPCLLRVADDRVCSSRLTYFAKSHRDRETKLQYVFFAVFRHPRPQVRVRPSRRFAARRHPFVYLLSSSPSPRSQIIFFISHTRHTHTHTLEYTRSFFTSIVWRIRYS